MHAKIDNFSTLAPMMRIKNTYILIIGYVFVILLFSCKKDHHVDIPEVSFQQPSEGSFFAVGDTVNVKVHIESKSIIKSVNFTLVDENLIPVLSNYSYPVNGSNTMSIDYAFIIDDYYLDGGDYQLLCSVMNQEERKDKYHSIKVLPVDKVLESIAVVCKSGNQVNIYGLGIHLNTLPELKFSMHCNYEASSYIPFHHRFALVGSDVGNMVVWDYFSKDTLMQLRNDAVPPFPYFTDLSRMGNYFCVSNYSGQLSFYDYLGNQKIAGNCLSGFFSDQVIDVSPNYLVVQQQKSGSNQLLSLHNNSNAYQYAIFGLPGNLIDAFPFSNKDFMVFFNTENMGQIEKYIFNDNATTEPVSYHGAAIFAVDQVDAYNYIFSTANEVFWYQYSLSSISSIVNGKSIKFVKYDPINNMIYMADDQNVLAYTYPNGQLLYSYNIGEEILDIHLIYNR